MYMVVDYFFIQGLINLIYSWDSRILPSNLLLQSKYCFKYTKLVGFTRLISYFSFYYSYLALFGILLSPSPKPQWFPPDSRNDPEPKGTTQVVNPT